MATMRGNYNRTEVTVDGDRIDGLKRRPRRGRFYARDHPNSTFGDDPVAAFVRFAQWRWEQRQRKGISKTEERKLPFWFSPVDPICPEIAATIRNACSRLDITNIAFALGIRPAELREIALEAVQQMSIFELASLFGLQPSRLRQVVIDQVEDDPSSTGDLPAALRAVIELHATGSEQGSGTVFLPDDLRISSTRERRTREWDGDDCPRS